jgi:hypothetical protein
MFLTDKLVQRIRAHALGKRFRRFFVSVEIE